jgi:hypothetical protein
MPVLQQVALMTPQNTLQAEVRASCIRCMGNIVEACEDQVQGDASAIFSTLVHMLEKIPYEDPSTLAIKEVSVNFASCLKENFTPYLAGLIGSLLIDANNELDIHIADTEGPEYDYNTAVYDAIRVNLGGMGTK